MRIGKFSRGLLCLAGVAGLAAGCGKDNPPAPSTPAAETKPAVPEEVQSAAQALLGSETQVLLFGDLANSGRQQFLAANVVPKTPQNSIPGTIVRRAVVAEDHDGKWMELLRCDEHLKNTKGYLGLTPIAAVSGWRLQFEQEKVKGLVLYFTPLQLAGSEHTQPIGVRWNPATQRYQSMDRTYQQFLIEFPSLENARSTLR